MDAAPSRQNSYENDHDPRKPAMYSPQAATVLSARHRRGHSREWHVQENRNSSPEVPEGR